MLACTSIFSDDRSRSACSLFFTMVMMTESSIEPVGAPAPISRVRTIVADRSRSAWRSDGLRRHWVICASTSPLAAKLPLAEVVDAASVLDELTELPCCDCEDVVLPDASAPFEDEAVALPVVTLPLDDSEPEELVLPDAASEPLEVALPETEALPLAELLCASTLPEEVSFEATVELVFIEDEPELLPVEAMPLALPVELNELSEELEEGDEADEESEEF